MKYRVELYVRYGIGWDVSVLIVFNGRITSIVMILVLRLNGDDSWPEKFGKFLRQVKMQCSGMPLSYRIYSFVGSMI